MAEANDLESANAITEKDDRKAIDNLECAVCLQTCVHPARLPCGHVFCYLCIKGIANQSKKCAMCRQEIPTDFIDNPNLLEPRLLDSPDSFDGAYQWFYEGRNGWWKYDERTNQEIEEAFSLNLSDVELLICGNLYVIDFEIKVQYPKSSPSRKRLIKRELHKTEVQNVKGVAGWWQYDERTSRELENAYKGGDRTCELLIAGFLYVVDMDSMLQLRRNDPSRRRRIKRDYATTSKKGIAGLRTERDLAENLENSSRSESDRDHAVAQVLDRVLHEFDRVTHEVHEFDSGNNDLNGDPINGELNNSFSTETTNNDIDEVINHIDLLRINKD